MLVSIIDHSISLISGVISVLFGFRIIGPKHSTNPKYDPLYSKWIKHLKWLGPLVILFAMAQIAIKVIDSKAPQTGSSYKAELRKSVEKSISEKGAVSEVDHIFESQEGFRILIPAGYTYSKPPNTNIGLVAILNPSSVSTPAIIVALETSNLRVEEFLEEVKQSLHKKKDKTHKFSETTTFKNGTTLIQRVNATVVRKDGNVIKSIMLFAVKNGKYYLVNIGVVEDAYATHVSQLEKIVASFEVR